MKCVYDKCFYYYSQLKSFVLPGYLVINGYGVFIDIPGSPLSVPSVVYIHHSSIMYILALESQ